MWLNSKELPGLAPVVQIQDLCTTGTPTTHHEVNVQIKLGLGMSGFSLSSKEGGPWSSHSETCTSLGSSRQHARVHPNISACIDISVVHFKT